jgi:hypothetical protein
VIRVGGEEFRFYADVENPTPRSSSQATGEGVVLRADTPTPSLANTLFNQRAVGDPRAVLATLEVLNEGPSKGVRYPIRTALAHIGRGTNNDVRLTDESVSEIHAKIQRRGDGWYAVDMNSTNGTWVDGSRVTGERRLDGAADIRFGGVKLRFIPAGMSEDASSARLSQSTPAERQRAAAASPDSDSTATAPQGGTSKLIWALLVLLVAAAAFFVLRGRA